MKRLKRIIALAMFIGLSTTLLLSSGCSDSDDPTPPGTDEQVNEMVKNLASGEISGEFNMSNTYCEEYDETTGEWNKLGVLYGKYNVPMEKFYIVDGTMYYEVIIKTYPVGNTDLIKNIWDAYQTAENNKIGLYVVKPFDIDAKTLAFKDFYNNDAKISSIEDDKLTITFHDITGFTNGDEGPIPTPPMHEVADYTFTSADAPNLSNAKTFSTINEAYMYVIKCGRENWEMIKRYMPEKYNDNVDFDALEKEFKNNYIIL